jgi:hypothetical protein
MGVQIWATDDAPPVHPRHQWVSYPATRGAANLLRYKQAKSFRSLVHRETIAAVHRLARNVHFISGIMESSQASSGIMDQTMRILRGSDKPLSMKLLVIPAMAGDHQH